MGHLRGSRLCTLWRPVTTLRPCCARSSVLDWLKVRNAPRRSLWQRFLLHFPPLQTEQGVRPAWVAEIERHRATNHVSTTRLEHAAVFFKPARIKWRDDRRHKNRFAIRDGDGICSG